LFYARVIIYNVLEAGEVVPNFLEWGFDSKTIAELDHDKEFIFIRPRTKKILSKNEQKDNRKHHILKCNNFYY